MAICKQNALFTLKSNTCRCENNINKNEIEKVIRYTISYDNNKINTHSKLNEFLSLREFKALSQRTNASRR